MATTACMRRVKKELSKIADGKEHEKFVALMPLDPTNLLELRGIIMAPPGSPIEGYILSLNVTIPPTFPWNPPKVCFKNKVWHPKIDKSGRISFSPLSQQEWKPATSLETVLVSVQMLLKDLGEIDSTDRVDGLLNATALEQYLYDQATYVKTSKSWTEQDNEGYGHIVFLDRRMSAIQSTLKVLGAVNYKGYAFCKKVNEHAWKLILVVVPNLALYCDHAELEFQQCKKLTEFQFAFEEEEITLDFGDGKTRDQCWKITSLSSQKIKKEDVISDPRTTKPATCDLELSWVRPEIKPQRVIHKFTLIGPQHSFDVCVDPDSLSSVGVPHRGVSPTERPTLVKLLKFPIKDGGSHIDIIEKVGTKYNKFGVLLLEDESGSKVDTIESHYREDPERINHEIFRRWLKGEGKQPVTWKTLTEVLHDSHLSCIAEEIEATFTKLPVQSTKQLMQSTKPPVQQLMQSTKPPVQQLMPSTKPPVQQLMPSTKPPVQNTEPSVYKSYCNVQ